MQAYDIIMLIVLAVATFIGFRKGLAWQIASLAAIFFSYVVAVRFRDVVADQIGAAPPWNTFLAMLILYVASSFCIWLLFRLVRGFIDRAKLKDFDRQLGAVFGMIKGGLLCVIITLFAVSLLGEGLRQQIIESRSGFYIARLIARADAVMPAEMHDLLHPYLHQLDERLEDGPTHDGPTQGDEMRKLEEWLQQQTEEIRTTREPGSGSDPFYQGQGTESHRSPQDEVGSRRY